MVSSDVEADSKLSPRDERRRILKSPNYNRMGFKDAKLDVAESMDQEFTSSLVGELREAGSKGLQRGDINLKLAEYYGFCWGVERAVAMAYQARTHFGDDQDIYITNEIIHNPQVNDRLHEMNIKFLEGDIGKKDYSPVEEGDVVILPAFGATIQEMQFLDAKDAKIVDTTCPWVSKVWNAVDSHRKMGQTTIIHGKWAHEETVATASFCDDYLIVKDMAEAEYVSNYILNGGDKAEFIEKFKNAMSKGFDPDVHLKKVGLANQTTMYKRETKEIGRMFETTMLKQFGPENLAEHYAEFDTICDATQERQDAVTDLSKLEGDDKVDFVLVVGGFDSSNTAHLKEIPEKFGIPAYHIDRAEKISADNTLTHREHDGSIVTVQNFLKKGPLKIGVTSGASTPDKCIEDALERIFMVHKLL
jgi:4-hydroxy-3-methylbut-2-enyl diphosphate reductase